MIKFSIMFKIKFGIMSRIKFKIKFRVKFIEFRGVCVGVGAGWVLAYSGIFKLKILNFFSQNLHFFGIFTNLK